MEIFTWLSQLRFGALATDPLCHYVIGTTRAVDASDRT
jgi:hypothetical protein